MLLASVQVDESNDSMEPNQRFAHYLFAGPAIIHIWWGICVRLSPKELVTTGMADIYRFCGHNIALTGWLMILIGCLAMLSIIFHARLPRLAFCLLMPQQVAMLISADKALSCILAGTFADGAKYDPLFISADQCYIFIIGIMHTLLIFDVFIGFPVIYDFCVGGKHVSQQQKVKEILHTIER